MSLDFYLEDEEVEEECTCVKCNNTHKSGRKLIVLHVNITHHLARMAEAAGIYRCLWWGKEEGYTTAASILPKLELAYELLQLSPEVFTPYSPSNGWGSYEGFVKALEEIIDGCKQYPNATIDICR